jgi:antirestriction protein ArdC
MPHPTPAHKAFADRASLYQEITDKIIAELEQGRLPWVQPWAGVSAPLGLQRNAAPAAPMVASNILILWCTVAERGFTGQTWLTFRQALKLGAHVRKGERGIIMSMPTASFLPRTPARRGSRRRTPSDPVPQALHGFQQ